MMSGSTKSPGVKRLCSNPNKTRGFYSVLMKMCLCIHFISEYQHFSPPQYLLTQVLPILPSPSPPSNSQLPTRTPGILSHCRTRHIPSTEARQGILVRGTGSIGRQQLQGQTPLWLLRDPHDFQVLEHKGTWLSGLPL